MCHVVWRSMLFDVGGMDVMDWARREEWVSRYIYYSSDDILQVNNDSYAYKSPNVANHIRPAVASSLSDRAQSKSVRDVVRCCSYLELSIYVGRPSHHPVNRAPLPFPIMHVPDLQ